MRDRASVIILRRDNRLGETGDDHLQLTMVLTRSRSDPALGPPSHDPCDPIESSDGYWQACVGVLLEKADLIVIDISSFSTSMSWELE